MDAASAAQWARGIIRSEMALRGWKYADLGERLRADGDYDENDHALANRIARGTFSAAFFFQCMEAMDVVSLHLDSLSLVSDVAARRLTREKLVGHIESAEDADLLDYVGEIEDVLAAGEKAKRGE